MSLSAGERLGPYEIIAFIGAGGMGEVYRARDPRLARDVAVKVLPEIFSKHPDRRIRFESEARAASALNHPGIVTVYDIGSENGVCYIVSEFIEGETLRRKRPDLPRAFRIPGGNVGLAYSVALPIIMTCIVMYTLRYSDPISLRWGPWALALGPVVYVVTQWFARRAAKQSAPH